MNAILRLLVNSQGLKLIRHGLAALGGWLTAQGFEAQGPDVASYLTALSCVGFSVLWSIFAKAKPSDETMVIARQIVGALMSQATTALAAFLASKGYEDPANLSADNVLFFIITNVVNSIANSPEKAPTKKKSSLSSSVLRAHIMLPFALSLLIAPAAVGQARSNTCVAIQIKPTFTDKVARLWSKDGKLWPQRSTLCVRFLDGSVSRQQDKAWREFAEIDSLVNLKFVRVTSEPAEIRVSFSPGKGHWSYVGTDCAKVKAPKATMNLDLGKWEFRDEWRRVAQHEMLHAIGFEHEHQSPNSNIPWDKPAVYAYYEQTQGWSKSMVDYQVINRYSGTNWQGTAFDKNSIMQYPVPGELTNFRFAVGWNSSRSALDDAEMRRRYP